MKTNPQTAEEWQQAVDAAGAWLVLESARAYGLIAGGPRVNVARCEELLREGKRLGFYPGDRTIDLVRELKEAGRIKVNA